MALSDTTLSSAIKAAIVADEGSAVDDAKLKAFCDAIAKAVVDHIKANAVVNSTGTVTSGAGSGGAVTAVGQIT